MSDLVTVAVLTHADARLLKVILEKAAGDQARYGQLACDARDLSAKLEVALQMQLSGLPSLILIRPLP